MASSARVQWVAAWLSSCVEISIAVFAFLDCYLNVIPDGDVAYTLPGSSQQLAGIWLRLCIKVGAVYLDWKQRTMLGFFRRAQIYIRTVHCLCICQP